MQEIIVRVPDTRVNFFLELLDQLGVQASKASENDITQSMQDQEDDLFIPEWHKEIVRERMRKNQNDPVRMLKWEAVRNSFELK